jgi:hypothetical protein
MEPNTNTNLNQPGGVNPMSQTAQPVTQPGPAPISTGPVQQPPIATQMNNAMAPNGSGKGGKTVALLIILLLLIVGIVGYVIFTKMQTGNSQKNAEENKTVVIPQATLTPTLAPENDLEVGSPEADLVELENDAKGL